MTATCSRESRPPRIFPLPERRYATNQLGPAVAAAVATRRAALTRVFDLDRGGNTFAIVVPSFDGDALRGMVIAEVPGNTWFASLLGGRFPDYRIDLAQAGQRVGAVRRRRRGCRSRLVRGAAGAGRRAELATPRDADGGRGSQPDLEAARGGTRAGRPARDAPRPVHATVPDGAPPRARSRGVERPCSSPTSPRATAPSRRCATASAARASSSTRSRTARSTCWSRTAGSPAGIRARRG